MARSYPSSRFPGGPYIEPSVTPALRGPKRTGPIGELVPGDDVEVARILARKGRLPRRQPVVMHIKLTQDVSDPEADDADADSPPSETILFRVNMSEDQALLHLVDVELYCTTPSTEGDFILYLRRYFAQEFDEDGVPLDPPDPLYEDMMMEDSPLQIDEGMYNSKHSLSPCEIDIEWSQVNLGDRIFFITGTEEEVGVAVSGLGIILTFK